MGNKLNPERSHDNAGQSNVIPFLQIVSYESPPSYYDGQEPLAIVYELCIHPLESDPTHLIVEYFETQNDGDGPVHIIRAGKVKREIFDEILAEAESLGLNRWTSKDLCRVEPSAGLWILAPKHHHKKHRGIFLVQLHLSAAGRRIHRPADPDEKLTKFEAFLSLVKARLVPFAGEPLQQPKFPPASYRNSSVFVDTNAIEQLVRSYLESQTT